MPTPGGIVAIAVHAGAGTIDGGDVTATLYTDGEVTAALADASFTLASLEHRGPLAHEHQGDRIDAVALAN